MMIELRMLIVLAVAIGANQYSLRHRIDKVRSEMLQNLEMCCGCKITKFKKVGAGRWSTSPDSPWRTHNEEVEE